MDHVLAVGFFVNILDKHKAHSSFLFHGDRYIDGIAAGKGTLIIDFRFGNHRVYSRFVQLGEMEVVLFYKLMTGVFEIVHIYRIIDDALQVAFIIAYL